MPINPNTIAMTTKKVAGLGTDNRGIRRGKRRGTALSMIANAEKAAHRTALPAAGSKQSEHNLNHPTTNTAPVTDIGSTNAEASDRWRSKKTAVAQRRLRRIRLKYRRRRSIRMRPSSQFIMISHHRHLKHLLIGIHQTRSSGQIQIESKKASTNHSSNSIPFRLRLLPNLTGRNKPRENPHNEDYSDRL